MKIYTSTRSFIIGVICILYVLLFTYAAASKLLDFENFQVAIGQSPLLSAFAGLVSWLVPFTELAIVVLLVLPRVRIIGLWAAFALMVLFTSYIYIILHYSSFVPCSCGGILEKMGWETHLLFNFIFIIFAAAGILLQLGQRREGGAHNGRYRVALVTFPVVTLLCIGLMALLFLQSEAIIHHENNFVRRFIPGKAVRATKIDLGSDAYYFAGSSTSSIYLGTVQQPLEMTVVDRSLMTKKQFRISLDTYDLPFRNARIQVRTPYFFVSDGTVPCIFRGKITDWAAKKLASPESRFSALAPVDSVTFAFRGQNRTNGESILGLFSVGDRMTTLYRPGLLQRQIDGVFDSDGMLVYDKKLRQLVYLYFYRNQFIVTDPALRLRYRGRTIDTTTRAKLKIVKLISQGERKLAAPAYVVNKSVATNGKLLYIHAALRGKFETDIMWKQASIIDVYDTASHTYEYSFYVYGHDRSKAREFLADGDRFYALVGTQLFVYNLH